MFQKLSRMEPVHTSLLAEADLRGAILRKAQLPYVWLRDVKLKDADLSGADLRETRLDQEQIDEAVGDLSTMLPDDLNRPSSWSKSPNDQPSGE